MEIRCEVLFPLAKSDDAARSIVVEDPTLIEMILTISSLPRSMQQEVAELVRQTVNLIQGVRDKR